MPEPPAQTEGQAGPPSDQPDPILDESFRLGEGQADWVELARRANRPPEPLGQLGPYALLEEIGRGGQGEVYKALQPGTGRTIALKRLAVGGLRIGSRAAQRFAGEVEAVTRLAHPNVVTVHAAEVIDGHAVLVMEWIDGPTIDRWADGVWGEAGVADQAKRRRVLEVFSAACDGVAHAHQRGVIHRDLKPSNIVVGAGDVPRVLDFGVARVLQEWRGGGSPPPGSLAWTATGFAGTPAYAPPEQLHDSGRSVDTRADVYGLGAVLYRIVCGQEVFAGKRGIAELLDAVRGGLTKRPSQVRSSIDKEIDCIVLKAMEPEPERRYQTVEALAEDVRRAVDGRPVLAHPPSVLYTVRRTIMRRPWTSLLVAGSIAAVSSLGTVAAVQAVRLSARSRDLATALATASEQMWRAELDNQRQIMLNRRLIEASMGVATDEAFVESTDVNAITVLSSLVEQLTPDDSEDTVVDLRMRLGFLLRNARRWAEAEAQFAAAQAISDRIDQPSGERAGRIAMRRTLTLRGLLKYDEALACIDRAIQRAATGPPTIYSAVLHLERMHCLNGMKRPTEEVLACGASFIAACDAHADRKSERTRSREESAAIAMERGRFAQAEVWMREALEIAQAGEVGAQSISRFRHRLAATLVAQDRWEEAEPFARAAADYRFARETAHGSRAHRFLHLHADVLHRLGRFDEAASRWELALLRPVASAKPDERLLAHFRLRLGAARLGMGEVAWGREALTQALSLGRTKRPDTDELKATVDRVEAALRESGWIVDQRIEPALGELAWMAGGSEQAGTQTEIEAKAD